MPRPPAPPGAGKHVARRLRLVPPRQPSRHAPQPEAGRTTGRHAGAETLPHDTFLPATAHDTVRNAARRLLGDAAFRLLEAAVRLCGRQAPAALRGTAPGAFRTGRGSKTRRRALALARRMRPHDLDAWQRTLTTPDPDDDGHPLF